MALTAGPTTRINAHRCNYTSTYHFFLDIFSAFYAKLLGPFPINCTNTSVNPPHDCACQNTFPELNGQMFSPADRTL